MAIDFNDPCAAAQALRAALNAAMVNGRGVEVEYASGNGITKRVKTELFTLDQIKAHIADLEGKCAALTGGKPKRFGLRAGGRL